MSHFAGAYATLTENKRRWRVLSRDGSLLAELPTELNEAGVMAAIKMARKAEEDCLKRETARLKREAEANCNQRINEMMQKIHFLEQINLELRQKIESITGYEYPADD